MLTVEGAERALISECSVAAYTTTRNNDRFYFLGTKIIVDFSHEIKRHLLLGRKAKTNLDSILSRDITLLTNVHIVKSMVFPVVMYRCESWTIKKAEC